MTDIVLSQNFWFLRPVSTDVVRWNSSSIPPALSLCNTHTSSCVYLAAHPLVVRSLTLHLERTSFRIRRGLSPPLTTAPVHPHQQVGSHRPFVSFGSVKSSIASSSTVPSQRQTVQQTFWGYVSHTYPQVRLALASCHRLRHTCRKLTCTPSLALRAARTPSRQTRIHAHLG